MKKKALQNKSTKHLQTLKQQLVIHLQTHRYILFLIVLLIIAFLMRFYNYPNRWGLAYDQARDVLVAKEAMRSRSIPLIGPFSSAGQFVYGPQWYWILMILVSVFPNWILSAWVLQTMVYVAMVFLMVAIGTSLKGRRFGLLLGILSAVSPAQIAQSTNLTSPSMVGFFAMLSVYVFLRCTKTQSYIQAILLGLLIGTAINVHFQAIGLVYLIPIASLLTTKKMKIFFLMLIGFSLPFIPLMIFDLRTNFFESKNFLDYYLYGQHNIYLPKRWLTYVGVFWPQAWARVIGGTILIGWMTIILLIISCIVSVLKRTMTKSVLSVIIAFLCSFIMLRYFTGSLYDGYLVFLHPYILILTGLMIYMVIQWKKILGILLIGIILLGSISMVVPEILRARNDMASRAQHWMEVMEISYPNSTFSMYDYLYRSTGFSLPFVLYLDYANKLDDQGHKIGFGNVERENRVWKQVSPGNTLGFDLFDLDSSSSASLQANRWAPINPSTVYHSTVEWYKDRTF